MKTIKTFAIIAALVGVTSLPLSAQNAGGGGGGAGGGGGGGQAGGGGAGAQAGGGGTGAQGIRVAPQPGQAPAPVPGGDARTMYWSPYNQNPWFVNPAVAQQMRMNPENLQSLRNNYQQNWERYQKSVNELPQNLTPEQAMQRQQELAMQFENEFSGSLDKTIPDQAMRQRFQQLQTQYQGLNAFDNPNLVRRLDLSMEQRRQINRMQQEWRRTMMRLSRSNGNLQDFDWRDFSRRSNLSINEILSPEQLTIWKEIQGESFDFPPDVYARAGGAGAGADGTGANAAGNGAAGNNAAGNGSGNGATGNSGQQQDPPTNNTPR